MKLPICAAIFIVLCLGFFPSADRSAFAQEAPMANENKIGLKSEKKAFRLSLLSTLAPVAAGGVLYIAGNAGEPNHDGVILAGILLGSAGIAFGPSTGYFYGGRPGRGLAGVGIRLGVAALGFGGMVLAFNQGIDEINGALFVGSFFAASSLIVGSAVWDIAAVKKAVRKRNEQRQRTGWILAPKYFAGHKAGGLELQMRF